MNNNFSNNLKMLRESKEILQKELAEDLNLDKTTISTWERGINYPEVETLIKIAEYFDISVDSLLGLSDNKKDLIDLTEDEKEILDNIKKMDRDEKNKLKGYINALLEYKDKKFIK